MNPLSWFVILYYTHTTHNRPASIPDVVDTIGEPGSEWLEGFLLNAGLVLIGFTVQVITYIYTYCT